MPGEIEERLLSHASIVEASVIGAPHPKYGESVAAFVRQAEQAHRPSDAELVTWVRETVGRHKAPENILGWRQTCRGRFPEDGQWQASETLAARSCGQIAED